jgi:8-oxo-dGTP pyrophosphatase MutT (NUDIX family)
LGGIANGIGFSSMVEKKNLLVYLNTQASFLLEVDTIMSIVCTNCGKPGHYYKECLEPITSFGIILIQVLNITKEAFSGILADDSKINGLEDTNFRFLMIRRKDSLGYIELLRGKYDIEDRAYIQTLVDQTSVAERQRLLEWEFNKLWEQLWNGPVSKPYRHEYEPAKMKFETIQRTKLQVAIAASKTSWSEPEWGFPKGRRGPNESEMRCAIREFWEETRFPLDSVIISRNILPLEESFFGSNKVHYRHKYYIGFCFDDIDPVITVGDNVLEREIGAIRWLTGQEAMDHIRPYNIEKKEMLLHVSSILRNYCFWIGNTD